MVVWFWLIAALVAGWMVHPYVTLRQTSAYNKQVLALRRQGRVTVGAGGRRYRGGRAFVTMAVDDAGVVDAIGLLGLTTFAHGRPVPVLRGQRVRRLRGDRGVPGLSRQQRDAARHAATRLLDARTPAAQELRGEVSELHVDLARRPPGWSPGPTDNARHRAATLEQVKPCRASIADAPSP